MVKTPSRGLLAPQGAHMAGQCIARGYVPEKRRRKRGNFGQFL